MPHAASGGCGPAAPPKPSRTAVGGGAAPGGAVRRPGPGPPRTAVPHRALGYFGTQSVDSPRFSNSSRNSGNRSGGTPRLSAPEVMIWDVAARPAVEGR